MLLKLSQYQKMGEEKKKNLPLWGLIFLLAAELFNKTHLQFPTGE